MGPSHAQAPRGEAEQGRGHAAPPAPHRLAPELNRVARSASRDETRPILPAGAGARPGARAAGDGLAGLLQRAAMAPAAAPAREGTEPSGRRPTLSAQLVARVRTKGRDGGSPARDAPHVNLKRTARKMSDGHAYGKHAREFRSIRSRDDFEDRVLDTVETGYRILLRGDRTAYYDRGTNTLVLLNPDDPDGGTMFKPTGGEDYVDRLR